MGECEAEDWVKSNSACKTHKNSSYSQPLIRPWFMARHIIPPLCNDFMMPVYFITVHWQHFIFFFDHVTVHFVTSNTLCYVQKSWVCMIFSCTVT